MVTMAVQSMWDMRWAVVRRGTVMCLILGFEGDGWHFSGKLLLTDSSYSLAFLLFV